ncbi:MAG: hypothetical protein ACI9U0_002375 [Flavobacteriales bacterium]|jgi:hypothetical protein|tara:strand:- start:7832 stop:8194 length:363 start_codon:yes stop_codon:yes gene_type:complete
MKIVVVIFAGLILIGCTAVTPVLKSEEDWSEISYESHIKKLVKYNCFGCHRGAYSKANLNLSTYSSVKSATQEGSLLDRINDTEHPMPMRGLMSSNERKQFLHWAKNGCPLSTHSVKSMD